MDLAAESVTPISESSVDWYGCRCVDRWMKTHNQCTYITGGITQCIVPSRCHPWARAPTGSRPPFLGCQYLNHADSLDSEVGWACVILSASSRPWRCCRIDVLAAWPGLLSRAPGRRYQTWSMVWLWNEWCPKVQRGWMMRTGMCRSYGSQDVLILAARQQ